MCILKHLFALPRFPHTDICVGGEQPVPWVAAPLPGLQHGAHQLPLQPALAPSLSQVSTIVVEGLHCKRPIQCLASSEILTPHPLTAQRVCTPRLWCRVRTHSPGGEWGINSSEDIRHCSVLLYCFLQAFFISKETPTAERR